MLFLSLKRLDMSNNIIQWKCRGFKTCFEELTSIVNKHKHVVQCKQETVLKDSDTPSLKYIWYIHSQTWFVNNAVQHRLVTFDTNVQTTSLSILLRKNNHSLFITSATNSAIQKSLNWKQTNNQTAEALYIEGNTNCKKKSIEDPVVFKTR